MKIINNLVVLKSGVDSMYRFKSIAACTILIADAHINSFSANPKQNLVSNSSALSLPLSFDKSFVERSRSFVKLHENMQFSIVGNKKTKKLRKNKASAKRFNTKVVNRFATHGLTQRVAKGYASAVAALLTFVRLSTITSGDILQDFSTFVQIQKAVKYGKTTMAKYELLLKQNPKRDNLSKNATFFGVQSSDVYSTEFIFKRLIAIAPIYSAVPRRVDKARYKNLRGKGGRYTVSVKKIPQKKSVIYGLMYLKTN